MSLISRIESILFVSSKPVGIKKLSAIVDASVGDVEAALLEIANFYEGRGINLTYYEGTAQFVSSGENAELVKEYLKEDTSGELTKPALETLAVIAYRAPVTKVEIEQVRGVNCSMSLRNLLIRGLIEAREEKSGERRYVLTHDFLNSLGIQRIEDLPDFDRLHAPEKLVEFLAAEISTEQKNEEDTQVIPL